MRAPILVWQSSIWRHCSITCSPHLCVIVTYPPSGMENRVLYSASMKRMRRVFDVSASFLISSSFHSFVHLAAGVVCRGFIPCPLSALSPDSGICGDCKQLSEFGMASD